MPRLRHRLSRPAAFIVALFFAPLVMGLVGGLLILPSTIGPGLNAIDIVGIVVLLSVPFGALSYLLVGGYMFWRTAKRGAERAIDFALTGFLANIVAGVIALPLALIIAIAIGETDPISGALEPFPAAMGLAILVHAFGLAFGPLYGMLFGWAYTRLTIDLAPRGPSLREVEAVFR